MSDYFEMAKELALNESNLIKMKVDEADLVKQTVLVFKAAALGKDRLTATQLAEKVVREVFAPRTQLLVKKVILANDLAAAVADNEDTSKILDSFYKLKLW